MSAGGRRVLLVEPWLAGSHQAWAEGWSATSRHRVDVVGLPGRAWRWRLRGGALPLAEQLGAWVAGNGDPDVVVVSGLVDVAQLLGLASRSLQTRPPVVVYQHESQLVHPSPGSKPDQEAALRNWMSWCAADLVLFNSRYHAEAVLSALAGFVGQLPEPSHLPFLERVTGRFEVLPVGVDLSWVDRGSARGLPPDGATRWGDGGAPVIVWPHRWETDKDPSAFVAALTKARTAGRLFRLVLAGEDPDAGSRDAAGARAAVLDRFGELVLAAGPFGRDEYREVLGRCDLVVSCAHHEFFGVAVVEAIAAGCLPLLPRSLAYPEVVPARWHPVTLYRPGRFGSALIEALDSLHDRRVASAGLAGAMERYDWSTLAPAYDDRIDDLCTD